VDISKDQTSQIEKILYRFKDSKNITDLMVSLLQEVSILEDTFSSLYNNRNIGDAVGVQLDQIGKIVGEARIGRDDDSYRVAISVRTIINKSSGTISDIEEILTEVESPYFIQIFMHEPASIYIYIKTPEIPATELKDLIQEALPAGVSLGYIGYCADEELLETNEDLPEYYELGFLELGGGELDIIDPSLQPILNAFTPYDKVYTDDFLDLSDDSILILSNETPLILSVETDADYIEESYLAEDPLYEEGALHSRPIENL
jgi:hypothetical protein|tara:strand:- start:24949 stop:25731 length:783 start_codon:yes stop_codon:yes gene_type:complete